MGIIAIIPARGGSKRLPGKNMIDVCGKPLIAYTIEAALHSAVFDRIIVSTDAPHIASFSSSYGGVSTILRTPELAADTTPTFPVIADVLAKIPAERFMLLQPTSPFRHERHIQEALHLFDASGSRFDFLASVTPAHQPNVLIHPLGDDGSMCHFDIDYSTYRSQNYNHYTPNGAIYIAKSGAYMKQKHFYGRRCLAYVMSKHESLDIDDDIDYELVKIMMRTHRLR